MKIIVPLNLKHQVVEISLLKVPVIVMILIMLLGMTLVVVSLPALSFEISLLALLHQILQEN